MDYWWNGTHRDHLQGLFKFRKVRTSWIVSRKIVTKNLNETIEMMEKNLQSTYSVAWIDCITSGKSTDLFYF